MNQYRVEFYENRNGERPAEIFLDSLDIKMRAKLVMIMKVLQEKGNELREPYSKHVTDGIFEIRGNKRLLWKKLKRRKDTEKII